MSDLLRSLKSDLTSRRILPLLIVSAVALVAAAGYALTGGSSPAGPSGGASTTASVPTIEGPEVSSAPASPHDALAETTSGGSYQHGGHIHNPFKPLPGGEASGGSGEASGTPASGEGGATGGEGGATGEGSGGGEGSGEGASGGSGEGGEGSSGSSGSGEGSSGGSSEGGEGSTGGSGSGGKGSNGNGSSGAGESVPGTVSGYVVTAKLTKLDEEGEPTGKPQLFADIAPNRQLPSKKRPLLVFLGVAKDAGSAVFLLGQPAILHGEGTCVPKPSNCEGIELGAKRSEELQYLEASGKVVSYELKIVRLSKSSGASGAAAKVSTNEGNAAAELISKLRLTSSVALLAAAYATSIEAAAEAAGASGTSPAGAAAGPIGATSGSGPVAGSNGSSATSLEAATGSSAPSPE